MVGGKTMEKKILGVLIALCMVSAFVGCDDPSSEKPGVNYKDSGFVGTWEFENVGSFNGADSLFITILILDDDGVGKRRKDVFPGSIVESGSPETGEIVNVNWTPLSNGSVSLEYDDSSGGDSIQERGTLAEDGLSFTLEDGSDYTKQ